MKSVFTNNFEQKNKNWIIQELRKNEEWIKKRLNIKGIYFKALMTGS